MVSKLYFLATNADVQLPIYANGVFFLNKQLMEDEEQQFPSVLYPEEERQRKRTQIDEAIDVVGPNREYASLIDVSYFCILILCGVSQNKNIIQVYEIFVFWCQFNFAWYK